MSMTTGEELGKSDVFVKPAVTLSPLVEEAVRVGITIQEFERGLFGGLRCPENRRLLCCEQTLHGAGKSHEA
jgi:hypothetical protein